MKRVMIRVTLVSLLLALGFTALTFMGQQWALPFAITFCTFLYHFAMRLAVGYALNHIIGNRADYTKRWYQPRGFEAPLYKALRVKQWKGHLPSYDPSLFDPKLHSWDEIAQAMCQAEIVHEIIAVLSFLPLLTAIPFGSLGVFLSTSIVSAGFDLCFVAMQRFNRPRVLKCLRLSQRNAINRRNTDDQMEPQIN